MGKSYSIDSGKKIMKNCGDGMPKKAVVEIFGIGIDILNRWTGIRKETGSIGPTEQTKYRNRKSGGKDLVGFAENSHSPTLGTVASRFSGRRQSIRSRLELLNTARRKKHFSMKKETGRTVRNS